MAALYGNRKLLQKYVPVNYNPDGYCIDNGNATTLDNHIKQHINDLRRRQEEGPFGFRLPRISPQEMEKKGERYLSPQQPGNRYRRSLSQCSVLYRHDNTRETSPKQLIPLSPAPVTFEHGKHWVNYPDIPSEEDTYPLNGRSNQFLMAYYAYLDEEQRKCDGVFKDQSHNLMYNEKQNMSCEEIYQFYRGLKIFGNYKAKKVSYALSQTNRHFISSLRRLKDDNENNDMWLRSYFGIAPVEKIKFGDLLKSLNTYRKPR